MAKPKQQTEQSTGKVKIRIIEFEVEGNDSTMQESLKSITAALNRSAANGQPATSLRYAPQSATMPAEEVDGDEVLDEDDSADGVESPPPRSRTASTRKPPTPKLLEIDFSDVTPTLKEFMAEKQPKTELHKYLAIAYWFKHSKNTPDLTPDYFFTAYRHMQWTVPRDPASPMRDLRHKKRTQMSAGSTAGTTTINHIGENIVMEMGKEAN